MAYFSAKTFAFLRDLQGHNDRTWFKSHEAEFEAYVREPALRFITDAAAWFGSAGLPYRGEAKKAGGALGRIHRDIRFSKDKTPYHTHVTIHFHHKDGDRGRTAPVIGLRFEADGSVGLGAGIWGADTPTLNRIRDAILADGDAWDQSKGDLEMWGGSLKTAPKGYDADHPRIEDIRRKQFVAVQPMTRSEFTGDLLPAFQAKVENVLPFCDLLRRATV